MRSWDETFRENGFGEGNADQQQSSLLHAWHSHSPACFQPLANSAAIRMSKLFVPQKSAAKVLMTVLDTKLAVARPRRHRARACPRRDLKASRFAPEIHHVSLEPHRDRAIQAITLQATWLPDKLPDHGGRVAPPSCRGSTEFPVACSNSKHLHRFIRGYPYSPARPRNAEDVAARSKG